MAQRSAIRLYLDIDGVFLGKTDPASHEIVLARHAGRFVEFALESFECYWLTTHCQGDSGPVIEYLRPYCDVPLLRLLASIRPTRWRTLKTEALVPPFLWLDDSPLALEIAWLRDRGFEDRWIHVDTRKRPDDLVEARRVLGRWLAG